MKADEPISSEPLERPLPSIPCGEACQFIYWMAVQESDFKVQQAKRYTLKLLQPQHPQPPAPVYVTVGTQSVPVIYRPQYEGFKESSEKVLNKDKLPKDVKKTLQERFLKPPGSLMNDDRCQWPCECIKERNSPAEAAGQGEEVISVWIDTDKVVDKGYIRRFDGTRTPPDPKKLIGDDSKPVTFDPETDVLDLEGIGGAHGTWQTWKVVRRYRTVLMIRIKYQATRQKGKCKQLFEV